MRLVLVEYEEVDLIGADASIQFRDAAHLFLIVD
jgi:hypothetical protein